MDHYTFLMKYQKLFEVPFNVEERMKYFGTSDMDEIVEIVCNYGVSSPVLLVYLLSLAHHHLNPKRAVPFPYQVSSHVPKWS